MISAIPRKEPVEPSAQTMDRTDQPAESEVLNPMSPPTMLNRASDEAGRNAFKPYPKGNNRNEMQRPSGAVSICAMPGCEKSTKSFEQFCKDHAPHENAIGFGVGGKLLTYPELFMMLLLDYVLLYNECDSFPRYDDKCFDPSKPEAYVPGLRVKYSELTDRDKCFIIFVSHRWLSPAKDGSGHPDRKQGNPKFKMLKKAIDKLLKGKLKGMRVLLWVDYSCLEQDGGLEVMRGIDSLPSYIERCDALLTPVVEAEGAKQWWNANTFKGGIRNLFEEYGSPAWKTYLSRGWCRVEVFVAANAPMHPDCNSFLQLQGGQGERRRVHLLYGEFEMSGNNGGNPRVLPPLQNKFLDDYDPTKGQLTCEADAEKIGRLMSAVEVKKAKVGYEGERNAAGQREGQGTP